MLLKKILYYLNPKNYFNREKGDLNIRAMHSINKISIFMFVIALMVLLTRWLTK